MQINITIVTLGHVDRQIDIRKIKNRKSKIFKIVSIQRMDYLPESDIYDGFLDHKISQEALSQLIQCPKNSEIAIALIPNRFDDNFYIHRLNNNCAAISLYGINDILSPKHISIENFVLKQIYEICALKRLINDFSSTEVYSIIHSDTRGCLFDLNGDRQDIIYNTEKPLICDSCISAFKRKQFEDDYLRTIVKELKRIRKPKLLIIENFIKKYPLLSILLSALFAILLNLISNIIFDKIKF